MLATKRFLLVSAAVNLLDIAASVDGFAPVQLWCPHQVSSHRLAASTGDADADEERIQTIRAAVYQAPAPSPSASDNPLAILTQVADSLRVASMHSVDVVLFPELYLGGGPERAFDRESSELNIIGNICGELGVACVLGYAESEGGAIYSSLAAYHAEGSRAANYRSVTRKAVNGVEMKVGHQFVETIPTVLQLPKKQEGLRELKVGILCGNDLLMPEITRHLVRSGAQAILASASFGSNEMDSALVEYVVPSRALENQVPILFANYAGKSKQDDELDFIGSSAIISALSAPLVCAPREEDGDLPCDGGYLLPCEVGALYAADIDVDVSSSSSAVQHSIDQWDLSPRIPDGLGRSNEHRNGQQQSSGFGKVGKGTANGGK